VERDHRGNARKFMIGMRKGWIVIALIIVAACGGTGADATGVKTVPADTFDIQATLSNGPAVFVLAEVEGKPAEPAVTFDHQCTAGHQVTSIRDTVIIASNASAHKGTRSDTYLNGVTQTGFSISLGGTWRGFSGNDAYYSAGPSIELVLLNANGTSAGITPLRLGGTTRLMRMSAIGGSCPGSPSDGRTVLFVYTRR
jgi:hypothetical protein